MALVDQVGATVVIAGRTEGMDPAIKAVVSLTAAIQKNQEKLAELTRANNLSAQSQVALREKIQQSTNAAIESATANTREAETIQAKMRANQQFIGTLQSQIKSMQGAHKGQVRLQTGIRGTTEALSRSNKEFKEYRQQLNRSGAQLVGFISDEVKGAQSLREVFRNHRLLKNSMRSDLSGIASESSIRSLSTGLPGTFRRAFTASERFRISLHGIKRDMLSTIAVMQRWSKQTQWLGRQMIMGLSLPIAAVAQTAVREFQSVTEAQANLQKITYETGETYEQGAARIQEDWVPAIRNIAMEYGQVESITTNVARDWAAMGYSTAEQNAQVTDLTSKWAMLANIDMSQSTEYIRKIFTLYGDTNVEKTSDILNRLGLIEERAAIDTKDLADAIPIVAPAASQLGMSVDELAASLAGMVEQGVDANEAATALKFGLQRLYNPTNKAQEALDALGVNYKNADNTLRPPIEVLQDLRMALEGTSQAAATQAFGDIFGSRQVSRMQALMSSLRDESSDFYDTMEVASMSQDAINRRNEEQTKARQQSADVLYARLKAQLKMAAADLGRFLMPPLIKIFGFINTLIKKLLELPDGVKKLIAAFTLLLAATGPIVYVVSVLGEAFATLGKGIVKILPSLNMLSTELAEQAAKHGLLGDKVFELGDTHLVSMSKRKIAALEAAVQEKEAALGAITHKETVDKLNEVLAQQILLQDQLILQAGEQAAAEQTAAKARRHAALAEMDDWKKLQDSVEATAASKAAAAAEAVAERERAIAQFQDLVVQEQAAKEIEEAIASSRANNIAERVVVGPRGGLSSEFFDIDTGQRVTNQIGRIAQDAQRKFGVVTSALEDAHVEAAAFNEALTLNAQRLADAGPARNFGNVQKKIWREVQAEAQETMEKIASVVQMPGGNWVDTRFGNRAVGAAEIDRLKEVAERNGLVLQSLEAQTAAQAASLALEEKRAAAADEVAEAAARAAAAEQAAAEAAASRELVQTVDGPQMPLADLGPRPTFGVADDIVEGATEGVADAAAETLAADGAKAARFWNRGFKGNFLKFTGMQAIINRFKSSWESGLMASAKTAASNWKKNFAASMAESGGFSGLLKALMGGGGGGAGGAEGAAAGGGILAGGASLAGVAAAIGVIVAVLALLVAPILLIKKHWEDFRKRIDSGVNRIKDAVKKMKDTVMSVFNAMKDAIAEAFGGGKEGEKKAVEKFAKLANGVLHFIGLIIDGVRVFIGWLAPVFEWFGHVMGNSLNFITSLLSGDWMEALKAAGRLVYSAFAEPVVKMIDSIIDVFLSGIAQIVRGAQNAYNLVNGLWGGNDVNWQDQIEGFRSIADDISIDDYINDQLYDHNTGSALGNRVGEDIADGIGDGFNDNPPELDDGGGGGGGGGGDLPEWLSGWLSAIKSRLDKVIADIKKDALEAFDKRTEAALAVFDKRIKKIDDVEKAEERALQRKAYLQQRRKMIDDRELQHENYMRDRALAIYEGRVDDARQMDREEQKNKQEHRQSLSELDADRRRELLKQERDHQRELINAQKEAEAERQKLMRDAFEKQLDLITEYAPRTVGEFQNMLNNITNLLGQYGINTWPGIMYTGLGLFADVINKANEDIVQEAAWSGKSAATAWLASFISGEAQAALTSGDGSGGGGGANRSYLGQSAPPGSRIWRNADTGVGASHYNRHQGGYLGAGAAQDIPITAQTGEYVIQRSAVQKYGTPFLSGINHGVYHTGGVVTPTLGDTGVDERVTPSIRGVLADYVKFAGDNWMADNSNRTKIAGVDPASIYASFMNGGTVGGKTMADFAVQYLIGEGVPIQQFANWINQTFPGSHAATGIGTHSWLTASGNVSLHSLQRAVDVSGPSNVLEGIWNYMLGAIEGNTIPIQELIYKHSIWSSSKPYIHPWTRDDHMTHVHIGLKEGFAQLMMNTLGAGVGGLGGPTPGPYALKMMVREAARNKWGTDAFWPALDQLIYHESSWNPYADNPTSSAYGLFQFLNSTRANYGIGLNASIADQIRTGLQYIMDRYGDPNNAWAMWQSRSPHWYHQGGQVNPIAQMMMGGKVPYDNFPALLHKGEIVVPEKHTGMLRDGGGGDTHVHIYADTFLGDFEWFRDKMEEYDVKITPKKARARGQVNRRIGVR